MNNPPILNYAVHSGRLAKISLFVKFVAGAIREFEQTLPAKADYLAAKDELVEGWKQVLNALESPPALNIGEFKKDIDSTFIISEPSRQLLYNLSLVMLCTEMEIFLEHLIDVILTKDPRRLKDLASQKQLNAAELVDLSDYESVMRRLRQKVIKEIIGSPAREMFVMHLGDRIGLFREKDLVWRHVDPKWGVAEIEAAWDTRHEIVHVGHLPCTKEYFATVLGGFAWLQTFLSFRARKKFGISIDQEVLLDVYCKNLFKIS